MYRIMLVKSKRDKFASLYQWLTEADEESGEVGPVEFADKEALDEKVEDMLNNGGYAKSDFIVVKLIDYTIDAMDYNI